jgi:hypothetical protein
MVFRSIAVFVVLALAAVPAAMGQSAGASGSAGLSVEMLVIRENSMAASREQNMFALSFTENAIGGGSADAEVYAALERMVFGGMLNRVVTSGGQVANNFPEVRREAARQLGVIGSENARAILLRACVHERDPLVMEEVIRSIGLVNSSDNEYAVSLLVRVSGMFHRANHANNHVALATVNALESIAAREGGLSYPDAFWYLQTVADGPYVPAVRARALEVIEGLRN